MNYDRIKAVDDLLNFDYTIATIIRIKKDITRLLDIIVIAVQVLFLGFYTYQIIVNIDLNDITKHLQYLIIYSSLALISLAYLIFYIVTMKDMDDKLKKAKSKVIKRVYRITKYFFKILAVSVAIFQIVTTSVTKVMILLTALSLFILFFNIISEIIITYIDAVIDRILLAFYMDRDNNTINKLITNDLNRNNLVIANEEKLREDIQRDRDKYIKHVEPKPDVKESWIVRGVKKIIKKTVDSKINTEDK